MGGRECPRACRSGQFVLFFFFARAGARDTIPCYRTVRDHNGFMYQVLVMRRPACLASDLTNVVIANKVSWMPPPCCFAQPAVWQGSVSGGSMSRRQRRVRRTIGAVRLRQAVARAPRAASVSPAQARRAEVRGRARLSLGRRGTGQGDRGCRL